MINFAFIDVEVHALDVVITASWLESVCQEENQFLGEINFVFCNDEYLLEINRSYLDHDFYTDVITFDYSEEGYLSGDVFVSVERVIDNAVVFDTSFLNELHRILVHGLLHLAGYKDKNDDEKKIMRSKEDYYLLSHVSRGTF